MLCTSLTLESDASMTVAALIHGQTSRALHKDADRSVTEAKIQIFAVMAVLPRSSLLKVPEENCRPIQKFSVKDWDLARDPSSKVRMSSCTPPQTTFN
jgi:hypothetical protein